MKLTLATVLATLFIAFVAATPKCPTNPVEDVILLRNPSNCSTFYACANGIPYLMNCNNGLHFNSELRVCDWPELANCKEFNPRPSTTTSETSADLSYESNESSFEFSEESLESVETSSESSEVSSTPVEVPSTSTEVPSTSTEVPSTSTEVPSTSAEVPSTTAEVSSTTTETTPELIGTTSVPV